MLYKMLTGRVPWVPARACLQRPLSTSGPLWNNISEQAKSLVTDLLHTDQAFRANVEEATHHPWFEGIHHCARMPTSAPGKKIVGVGGGIGGAGSTGSVGSASSSASSGIRSGSTSPSRLVEEVEAFPLLEERSSDGGVDVVECGGRGKLSEMHSHQVWSGGRGGSQDNQRRNFCFGWLVDHSFPARYLFGLEMSHFELEMPRFLRFDY